MGPDSVQGAKNSFQGLKNSLFYAIFDKNRYAFNCQWSWNALENQLIAKPRIQNTRHFTLRLMHNQTLCSFSAYKASERPNLTKNRVFFLSLRSAGVKTFLNQWQVPPTLNSFSTLQIEISCAGFMKSRDQFWFFLGVEHGLESTWIWHHCKT